MNAMKARTYINSIAPLAIPYVVPQSDGLAWIMKALQRDTSGDPNVGRALHLYERMIQQPAIRTRRTVLKDYTHLDWDAMHLYRPHETKNGQVSPWHAPALERRMQIFGEAADRMIVDAFDDKDQPPDSLIEISCTGYRAPFPAQRLLLQRGWHDRSRLLKLGHMGCYASVPGLNLASKLCETGERVSCISYELCTLHLQPLSTDPEQIVANTIFADGGVRIDLSPEAEERSLAFLGHREALIPGSLDKMSWTLESSAFHMTLNREIPQILASRVAEYVEGFLDLFSLRLKDVHHVAIHPGGPRIIETVQKALGLEEERVKQSKAILASHGNMSSATLPHIWHAILHDDTVNEGALILSLAFGPGLTVAMNLLRKIA